MERAITLSPSRARRWIRCKRSYYWRYERHLNKVRKDMPPTLGLVVGKTLEGYYKLEATQRSQESILKLLNLTLTSWKPRFLKDKDQEKDWQKIVGISTALITKYHAWVEQKDNFKVLETETTHEVEIAPGIWLLAIPDAVVETEGSKLILEHKVRYRYRTGDFGVDYQAPACCLVTESIGTLFNVLEYSHGKLIREPIIRSEHELAYFKEIFISIAHDIISTCLRSRWSPYEFYHMPMKRCTCEYWELCNAEIQGLDIDDIVSELYINTHAIPHEGDTKETEVEGTQEAI